MVIQACVLRSKGRVAIIRSGFIKVFSFAFIFPLKWRDNRAGKVLVHLVHGYTRKACDSYGRRGERALYDPPRSVHFDPFARKIIYRRRYLFRQKRLRLNFVYARKQHWRSYILYVKFDEQSIISI